MAFSRVTDEAIQSLRDRIGKPINRVTQPFYTEINSDAARTFAYAIGDDNPLWTDREYGKTTQWGSQLAPPTILYSADNVVSGAVEGLPGVHAMYSGTNWRWFAPIKIGTALKTQSKLKDMVEHRTNFAGRSFQQIYTTEFFDQHGTMLASADSWCFRTERDTAREEGTKYKKAAAAGPRKYTPQEIEKFAEQYRSERRRGSEKLLWSSVKIGDEIGPVLKGPYTVTSAVAFMQAWGSYAIRNHKIAWDYYERHPKLATPNELGIPEPPVRVHWDNTFAQAVGVPGAYDFGPERVAWIGHMLTDWIGDTGFLRLLNVQIRRHNPVGDAVFCHGRVTAKRVEEGKNLVECEVWAVNQDGETSAKGVAVVELPA